MIDRGFQLMIPKEAEEEVLEEKLYDYQLKFTLFQREFVLNFSVKQKQE